MAAKPFNSESLVAMSGAGALDHEYRCRLRTGRFLAVLKASQKQTTGQSRLKRAEERVPAFDLDRFLAVVAAFVDETEFDQSPNNACVFSSRIRMISGWADGD